MTAQHGNHGILLAQTFRQLLRLAPVALALLFVTLPNPIAPVPKEEDEDEHSQHQHDDDSRHKPSLQHGRLLHIAWRKVCVAVDGEVLLY